MSTSEPIARTRKTTQTLTIPDVPVEVAESFKKHAASRSPKLSYQALIIYWIELGLAGRLQELPASKTEEAAA